MLPSRRLGDVTSAGGGDGAIVFSCIANPGAAGGRRRHAFRLRDASDDELLRLFADAPALGKLT